MSASKTGKGKKGKRKNDGEGGGVYVIIVVVVVAFFYKTSEYLLKTRRVRFVVYLNCNHHFEFCILHSALARSFIYSLYIKEIQEITYVERNSGSGTALLFLVARSSRLDLICLGFDLAVNIIRLLVLFPRLSCSPRTIFTSTSVTKRVIKAQEMTINQSIDRYFRDFFSLPCSGKGLNED